MTHAIAEALSYERRRAPWTPFQGMKPRWGAATGAAIAAGLLLAPAALAARTHGCPNQDQFSTNMIAHGMNCGTAYHVHNVKVRECPTENMDRTETATEYVYTCSFGPWSVTERIAKSGGFYDRVYVGKGYGRVWMRYESAP